MKPSFTNLLRPIDIKRNALSKRLAELSEEYGAAMKQIGNKLNNVDRIKLKREADEIYEEMEEIDSQIEQLDQTESLQELPKLNKNLHQIDFKEVKKTMDKILTTKFGSGANAALFLLQKSYSMAGGLYIKGLLDHLSIDHRIVKHCLIDLPSRQGATTEQEVLDAIAEYFQPIDRITDLSQYSQAIVKNIQAFSESGSVVFFDIRDWDKLHSQERLLSWFIDGFWLPLSQQLPSISEKYRRVRFIAIICAESTLSDECLKLPHYCNVKNFETHKIIKLTLKRWTERDLSDWLERYSGLPAEEINQMAKRIYRVSERGIPQLAVGKLKHELEVFHRGNL